MKTYKKVLMRKDYTFKGQYWSGNSKPESHIEFIMWFDFKEGLRFSVSLPNVSACYRNPFKAFMWVLEHENVKGMKYDDLKYNMRSKGLHRNL